MKISGEVLAWTGVGITLALLVGGVAGTWFESETPGILSNILNALKL